MDKPQIDYREYVASQEWRRRRRAYLRRYPGCSRCGMTSAEHKEQFDTALHVHHVSYARLGSELDDDLETLCKRCHDLEENSEYDPSEASADMRALELGVGEDNSYLVHRSGATFSEPFSSPPERYWNAAIKATQDARKNLPPDDERSWIEVERLIKLEQYARRCKELALEADQKGL